MREIKFRGRRVDTGELVYGDLITISGEYYSIFDGTYRRNVYRDSVTQLVGYDSYGNEIYEKDAITVGTEAKFRAVLQSNVASIDTKQEFSPKDFLNASIESLKKFTTVTLAERVPKYENN